MRRSRGPWLLARVVAVVALASVAASAASARPALRSATDEAQAQAEQACADRWGWMHFTYPSRGTRAVITATAPCEIYFDYGDRGDGTVAALPCNVNGFGAYACAGHAQYELPASTEWNATIQSGGRLVLGNPPSQRRRVARPRWTTRYTVVDGYIRPFSSRGRLLRGLSLHGSAQPVDGCGVGTARSRKLTCVTGYTCFAKRLPLRAGDRIACPDAPGSTRFKRGYATAG